MNWVLLGLGANIDGAWGRPKVAFERALQALGETNFDCIACSPLYRTEAVAAISQPDYLNCVILGRSTWAPGSLLRFIKGLERASGRQKTRLSGVRPLDIDILDLGGRVLGWPPARGRRAAGQLILPHPNLHTRAFVLQPLLDVAPAWQHPALRCSARVLLAKLATRDRVEMLDCDWHL